MKLLAVATLVAYFIAAGAVAKGGGTAKGFHILLPLLLSFALALWVLAE